MALVVLMRRPGGTEALDVAELSIPDPGPGEIRVRQTAIGVNFVDIYHRTGVYAVPAMPAVLGVEAVGIVTAVGPDVTTITVGERIAYAGALGAYASERLLPAWRAILMPSAMPDDVAATALTRGITAQMLIARVHPVTVGTIVLVHAAAGGLGALLTRWAKHRGAVVIGTVGSAAKAAMARRAGADHVIVGRDADYAREVAALTNGAGVDVAYDGIGGSTLLKTFDCMRPFGAVASIGQAAGPAPPLSIEELGPRRSISLARYSVMRYMADPATYQRAAAEVMAALAAGITQDIGARYGLADAAAAQADLEAGKTTGCSVLIP